MDDRILFQYIVKLPSGKCIMSDHYVSDEEEAKIAANDLELVEVYYPSRRLARTIPPNMIFNK